MKRTVSAEQARIAVERLIRAVRLNSGVSYGVACFLLATHGGEGNVDFRIFSRLDPDNFKAAAIAMRYSIFERRYELPLEWEEAEYLFNFWQARTTEAA